MLPDCNGLVILSRDQVRNTGSGPFIEQIHRQIVSSDGTAIFDVHRFLWEGATGTYQIENERKRQEEHPQIQMHRVAKDIVLRIIEPSSSQGCPDSLTEDV